MTKPKQKQRHRPARLLLTVEQERRARQLFKAGHTRDQVAGMIGVTVALLARRLGDQLKDIRVGRGRSSHRKLSPDPTPEQIAERIEEVHAMRLERFNRLHGEG